MWFAIVGFLAWAGGWRKLARHYRGEVAKDFGGRKMRTVTLGRGRFPRVHYRNTLWMRFDDDEVLIRPHVLFRWAHSPLIIPRSEITAAVRKGILRRFAEMKTAADPKIGFHLPIRHYGWPEDLEDEIKPKAR